MAARFGSVERVEQSSASAIAPKGRAVWSSSAFPWKTATPLHPAAWMASARSRDFPIPASPSTKANWLLPPATWSTTPRSVPSSWARPMSGEGGAPVGEGVICPRPARRPASGIVGWCEQVREHAEKAQPSDERNRSIELLVSGRNEPTNTTWPHGGSPGSNVTRSSMEVTVPHATPRDIRQ